MADALLRQVSPNGNITATVEADDRCVYLYLNGAAENDFGVRSCWVRNLTAAPETLDVETMKAGRPPMLPARACAHPDGAPRPLPGDLRLVWLEQGDGAALLEDEQLLAVVPSWSGRDGFAGYARDCIASSPLCWPLHDANVMHQRVAIADAFWRSWQTGDPWHDYQQLMLPPLGAGLRSKTYQSIPIDGKKWPPKSLLRFPYREDGEDAIVLVTLGVGLRPQPGAEQYEGMPTNRIELGIAMERELMEREKRMVWGHLAALAEMPWQQVRWLYSGGIIGTSGIPVGPSGVHFDAVLLLTTPPDAPTIVLPSYRDDEVHLLWCLPITASEHAFAHKHGSATLTDRMFSENHGWIHRDRKPVV